MTPSHWLRQLNVQALSLVDKGANKRCFQIYKSHNITTKPTGENMAPLENGGNTPDTLNTQQEQRNLQEKEVPTPTDSPQPSVPCDEGSSEEFPPAPHQKEQEPPSSEPKQQTSEPPQPSVQDIAAVAKALQGTLQKQHDQHNKRIQRMSEQMLQLEARVQQLLKSAGVSNGETAQAQQEAHTSRQDTESTWESITDALGYVRKDVLRKRREMFSSS